MVYDLSTIIVLVRSCFPLVLVHVWLSDVMLCYLVVLCCVVMFFYHVGLSCPTAAHSTVYFLSVEAISPVSWLCNNLFHCTLSRMSLAAAEVHYSLSYAEVLYKCISVVWTYFPCGVTHSCKSYVNQAGTRQCITENKWFYKVGLPLLSAEAVVCWNAFCYLPLK